MWTSTVMLRGKTWVLRAQEQNKLRVQKVKLVRCNIGVSRIFGVKEKEEPREMKDEWQI